MAKTGLCIKYFLLVLIAALLISPYSDCRAYNADPFAHQQAHLGYAIGAHSSSYASKNAPDHVHHFSNHSHHEHEGPLGYTVRLTANFSKHDDHTDVHFHFIRNIIPADEPRKYTPSTDNSKIADCSEQSMNYISTDLCLKTPINSLSARELQKFISISTDLPPPLSSSIVC